MRVAIGRVEIEDADVGRVHVRRARRPHVRGDAVLIREPHESANVHHDGMMYDAILLRDLHALEPRRESLHDVLLEKSLLADTAVKPLHGYRAPRDVWQHHGRDHLVILRQLALGDAVVGEEHLLRVRDHALSPSRTTSRALLSGLRPMRRECRSLPCTVHSMNETCTT